MKKRILPGVAILVMLMLSSCFKSPDTSSLSSDFVVATDRDLRVDFGTYATYHISDTIPKITDDPVDTLLVGAEAIQIVDQIKANMDARGYVFVERSQNPDLALIPAIVRITNIGTVCSGWWWGYPGYWPPGYWGPPGYGYYYPYCGIYSYETGSLNIDMLDLANTVQNNNINATWTAVMFGSLNSSDQVNLDRSLTAIDQAFEQSPYITTE